MGTAAPVARKPHMLGVETTQVAASSGTVRERMFRRAPPGGKPIRQGVDATDASQVAAASGTQEYHSNYGEGLDYGDDSDDSKDEESGDDLSDDLSPVDIDDDSYVDIDSDSEDEMRSSFPKDKSGKTPYVEGPQKRDTSGMTADEKAKIEKEDQKIRKKWTDAQRRMRIKKAPSGDPPFELMGYCGDQLRPLAEVEKYRLSEGQMFPNRNIFWLRVGEEALLRGIRVRAMRSEETNLTVCGSSFHAAGSFREGKGFMCTVAVVRDGDDTSKIPKRTEYERMTAPVQTPLYYKWIIPIIEPTIQKKPGVDYEMMRTLLRPYAPDDAITNAVIQRARDAAKLKAFGTSSENVCYVKALIAELNRLGHHAEVTYSTRALTMATINTVVVNEENVKRKKDKKPLLDGLAERKAFWKEWKEIHSIFLSESLGIEGGPAESKFVTGILVAPNVSTSMFHHTQEVIQADAAHTSFGKYTLFSAYNTTANGNMSNVAFAILFGNEDTKNWTTFWTFVAKVHPTIDRPQVTLLTDQDKGSITSVKNCIPNAHNFHCSFHRIENIKKYCGGARRGGKSLTALWLYGKLSMCRNMKQLNAEERKYIELLHPTDRHYLTKIPYEKQYAAARCAMGNDICMYGRSASSGVESMNNANKLVREKTAVDIANATILLLKLEGARYHKWKETAWGHELPLTPKGMELMEMVMKNVKVSEYRLTTHTDQTYFYAKVSKITVSGREFDLRLPKESYNGSHFGICSCGFPSKEGIPCQHMVVLVKANVFPILTRVNIMPYFWTTAQWQIQYPLDLDCNTEISLNALKKWAQRDDTVRYCPDWSTANKSGRRKNSDKQLSVSERMELESAKKKRKRRVKLYCAICHKFNHNTAECFKNPINSTLDERSLDDDSGDVGEYKYDDGDEFDVYGEGLQLDGEEVEDGDQDGDEGTV